MARSRRLIAAFAMTGLAVALGLFPYERVDAVAVAKFSAASKDGVPDQYWVETASDVPASGIAKSAAREHGGRVKHVLDNGFVVQMSESQARALAKDSDVVRVLQDTWLRPTAVSQPNPPKHLDRINERVLPLDGAYYPDLNSPKKPGAGKTIYVIDSGINTAHVAFGGRASNAIDVANDPGDQWYNKDCTGHGTAVAALAGGDTYGVARGASIVGIKVQRGCETVVSRFNLVAAVNWITNNAPPKSVVNISIAGPAFDGGSDAGARVVEAAIRASVAAGHTYVVGAGNNDGNACDVSPARMPEVIAVAASSAATDVRWPSSNFGFCVNLYAPGENITTASNLSPTATLTGSGTSFAAPQVAGAVAFRSMSGAPNPGFQVEFESTPNAVKDEPDVNAAQLLHVGGLYANPTDVPIKDKATVSSTIAVSGEGDPGAALGTVLRINAVIKHQARGQLQVDLVVPTGKKYRLHSMSNDTGDDLILKQIPVNASDIPPNGNWQLQIFDGVTGTTGTLIDWNIQF
ncbi:hypothetical protein E1218_08460 [Kribbella turkmenica]|uniref:P/Homo B domain-containing protein n=1 Tax=Kribbella turkmenica TaxID=2530375 RepID=A0A4R4XC66_9ACTN|nr:S8 family serine peptidase [Kribbella turkmenica]TDD28062.1 hypothetical protein E1218_08460 [Kribbella turkmenica]